MPRRRAPTISQGLPSCSKERLLLAKAGCNQVFMGVETVRQETLNAARKRQNKVRDYLKQPSEEPHMLTRFHFLSPKFVAPSCATILNFRTCVSQSAMNGSADSFAHGLLFMALLCPRYELDTLKPSISTKETYVKCMSARRCECRDNVRMPGVRLQVRPTI